MTLLEQELSIGTQRIAYYSSGPTDRTIVFIHGNSSCKDAFQSQYPAVLEAGYGVLALDLPGHGKSSDAPQPETDYTLPAYAELVQALCRQIGVINPVLFGWSLGGHIALQLIGNGGHYAGLVICGTPPIGLNPEDAALAFSPSEFSAVTGEETPGDTRLAGYIADMYGTTTVVPEPLLQAGFRTDGRSRVNMVAHWQTGAGLHDQRAIVETWNKPLLIVHGTEDAFVSASFFESLTFSSGVPGSTLKMLDQIGHAPFLEAPNVFNDLLIECVARSFAT